MSKHLIYGLHAVKAALQNQKTSLGAITIQSNRKDDRLQEIVQLAEDSQIKIYKKNMAELDELTDGAPHQGVVAMCAAMQEYSEEDLPGLLAANPDPLLLILDGVTDPHNLGACLRTADATGVTAVIVPKDRAVGLTPVVRKVACGAAETVPLIIVTNLARTLRDLKEQNVWLYGLDDAAPQSLYEAQLTGAVGIVMGAEGEGMRRLTRELCDFLIHIPMEGSVSSLNVSVATGVCLYEVRRQKKAP